MNVGDSNLYSKTTAEMNATGVVYTPGVCFEGVALSTLLGALYTYRRGYSTLSFIEMASDGQNGDGR